QAAVLDAALGDGLEPCSLVAGKNIGRARAEQLEQRLGTFERRAVEVEPQRHLAVAERIRLTLAEAQRALLDLAVAAAAFGPAARCGFDDMRHVVALKSRAGARAPVLRARREL